MKILSVKNKTILIIFLVCLFTSTSNAIEFADPTVDSKKEKLHWDIDDQIRVSYMPPCRLSETYIDWQEDSMTHWLFKKIDFFHALRGYSHEEFMVCKEPGLRVTNRNKKNGVFDYGHPNSISINGTSVSLHTYEHRKLNKGDINNFQILKTAIENSSEIVISVRSKRQEYDYFKDEYKPHKINFSRVLLLGGYIEDANNKNKTLTRVKINSRNSEIRTRYIFVIFYDLLAVILIISALFSYRRYMHQKLKGITLTIYGYIIRNLSTLNVYLQRVKLLNRNKIGDGRSIPRELLDWKQLYNEGEITKEEYESAKNRLLNRQ